MAPTRKSRSVNKRYKDYAEFSPEKSVGNSEKCQPQKRKLSDLLASRWSKDELERFYQAYRKYGKNWKKVAIVVRNRTAETVEALYNTNRAYLSLPDGTASVAGLIAMMTDHYNTPGRSGSGDLESNDASKVYHRPKKCSHENNQLSGLKGDLSQSPAVALRDGLSLSRRRSDGCTVRKRTPRVPVSYSSRKDSSEMCISSFKRGCKTMADENVDHVAALALTEASQRSSSPQSSQSPCRTNCIKFSPLKSGGKMSELLRTKLHGTLMDEDYLKSSFGCKGAENGIYARHASTLMDGEGAGTAEVCPKGSKINRKRENMENIKTHHLDDGRACSGNREGLPLSNLEGRFGIEVRSEHSTRSSLGKQKRNKKLKTGELEALHTLAEMSLMMTASEDESESPIPLKEERSPDLMDRPTAVQACSTSRQRSKHDVLDTREKVLDKYSGSETCVSENFKAESESKSDFKCTSEEKHQSRPNDKSSKGNCISSSVKKSKVHDPASSRINRPLETDAFAEEEKNVVSEACQESSPSKQSKPLGDVEYSSSNTDTIRTAVDSAVSYPLSPTSADTGVPVKRRIRRKMDPKRTSTSKNFSEFNSKEQFDKLSAAPDGPLHLKGKVSSCLSSYMVRRWCIFEWFYSAIDYPWFAKREFVEYLNHVGLGHIPRLAHVEWGVIRSSLGKPRRFSENFLYEEREKLKQYRDSVRKHYTELRTGVKEGLPTDLAQPLSVGQRVIAIHPKSREVHDGSVLTVDHDKCWIQFDRPELGVEIVMDIDCMPLDPLGNMPEAIRRQHTAVDRSFMNATWLRPGQSGIGGSMMHVMTEFQGNVQNPAETLTRPGKEHTTCAAPTKAANIVNAKYAAYSKPSLMAQIDAGKTDICALSELTRPLDKKVSSASLNLSQCNMYAANFQPPWLKPHASSSGLFGPIKSPDNSLTNKQELGSGVVGIVNGSKLEAQKMVHTAIQAISKLKVAKNAFASVVDALDSLDICKSQPDYGSSPIRSSEQVNGGLAFKNQLTIKSEPLPNGHASDPKPSPLSEGKEAQILSELITSCVATWLMIQMCTERQCPPADVAQILDSAVTSLHPWCSQNLPIYREIQMCMGKVKTQILALVPT